MNPKKKPRRCRGLGLDSGLDLAISSFIHSLVPNQPELFLIVCTIGFKATKFGIVCLLKSRGVFWTKIIRSVSNS